MHHLSECPTDTTTGSMSLFSALALVPTLAKGAPAPGGFWQLTDVHVDLLKECSGTEAKGWYGSFDGEYGCGCSVDTVNATADFMVATHPAPSFILFTGDATASGDIIDNLQVIKGSVEKRFPSTPFYLVLGNHDFPASPVGPAATSWYNQVADTWGVRWLDSAALDEFRRFGYYSTTPSVGSPRLRLVVLNTELFNHGNDHVVAGETINEALAHLVWLNATLASVKAAGQRAYVLGHVPLGMETAYGNDRRVPSVLRPYWMDLFAKRYQDIIDNYGEAVVAVQIFGHEHVDTFRLLGKTTVGLSVPSLSTAYPRTNPTVRYWHQLGSTALGDDWSSSAHVSAVQVPADHGSTGIADYDQYIMDLLRSNAHHIAIFNHTYSFKSEYGLPDLSRSSFETLLSRFSMETHVGHVGYECTDQADAIYVPNRSISHADAGINATKEGCEQLCAESAECALYQWGHSSPDFDLPNAWCYLLKQCGTLQKDTTSAKYHPKYGVWAMPDRGGHGSNRSLGDQYARERRFFLSSTPTTIQPLCDDWCMMQDLCDKQHSGIMTSNMCFTECLENDGRALVPQRPADVHV